MVGRSRYLRNVIIFIFTLPGFSWGQFDYSKLTLVDSVECATDTTHDFTQYPENISQVETVLGQQLRTLSNSSGDMKYFAYRMGKGMNLQADKGYILRVIYPQDQPRSMFIINRGCETARGFHTGRTLGDGRKVPYINSNPESLELPLSGQLETWDMLFYLQERFPDLKHPRGNEVPRDQTPADGFWVFCLQLSHENDPVSSGVAVQKIELYEAPPLEQMTQPVATLPPGLPKRHLFWREEMPDNVVASQTAAERGFDDDLDWYEHKFRLMKFLGMRTFAKDLLEFGANQGWDSSKHGGNSWVYQTSFSTRWTRIVKRCGELGYDLMPYYEYAGSKGSNSLGFQKRARPLKIENAYTHITWGESANVDITDPDTFEDFRKMLEITVIDEKSKANFAGIWVRQRVSDLPISFADATLARFATATGRAAVTRQLLIDNNAIYGEYRTWWYGKRREFLMQVRDYLRTNVHGSMDLLFTADSSESGKSLIPPNNKALVAENPAAWTGFNLGDTTVKPLSEALANDWQLNTLTSDWSTWGSWEWQHSIPHPDPSRYTETDGIYMTQTVNRAYTLDDEALTAFRAKDGLATIRHYSLNEDATEVGGDNRIVGYFVADVDYAGPFVMLPEALAFAKGDPRHFGYLASNNFNRGNPYYARRFNANFLSLPALPSTVTTGISDDAEVIVRRINTPANGSYLGVVNTGRQQKTLTLTLPEEGHLLDAVTGKTINPSASSLTLTLDPCELRSFRYFPVSQNTAPEVQLNDAVTLEWFNALSNGSHWRSTPLTAEVIDYDTGDTVTSASWTVTGGDATKVQLQDATLINTMVAFSAPGTYVLTLTASDGTATRTQDVTFLVVTKRHQIVLDESMADYTGTYLNTSGLFNDQAAAGDPPSGNVGTSWSFKPGYGAHYPHNFEVDLGQAYQLDELYLFDANGRGTFKVYSGTPGGTWTEIVNCTTDTYLTWKKYEIDANTRYLKCELTDGGGIVGEMVLFGSGHGMESTDQIPSIPLKLELKKKSSSLMDLGFRTNPFHSYSMQYTPDLVIPWQTIGTYDDTTPFPLREVAIEEKGFYRLGEIVTE